MNEQAVEKYMDNMAMARELAKTIVDEINDFMCVAPKDVNWGHVGDSQYVLESLRDIARFFERNNQ